MSDVSEPSSRKSDRLRRADDFEFNKLMNEVHRIKGFNWESTVIGCDRADCSGVATECVVFEGTGVTVTVSPTKQKQKLKKCKLQSTNL